MNIPSTPKPENPAFADKVIGELQDKLKTKLSWLNYSFGKSQKLVSAKRDGKTPFFYPGIHLKKDTYISVLPDQSLGNFSFVVLDDPQTITFNPNSYNKVSTGYALIFWFNLSKIFPASTDRNLENVKEQIVQVLTRELFLTSGSLTVEKIFEQAENVYRGYSLKEVEAQFMMHPFAGLRFEGLLTFTEGLPC